MSGGRADGRACGRTGGRGGGNNGSNDNKRAVTGHHSGEGSSCQGCSAAASPPCPIYRPLFGNCVRVCACLTSHTPPPLSPLPLHPSPLSPHTHLQPDPPYFPPSLDTPSPVSIHASRMPPSVPPAPTRHTHLPFPVPLSPLRLRPHLLPLPPPRLPSSPQLRFPRPLSSTRIPLFLPQPIPLPQSPPVPPPCHSPHLAHPRQHPRRALVSYAPSPAVERFCALCPQPLLHQLERYICSTFPHRPFWPIRVRPAPRQTHPVASIPLLTPSMPAAAASKGQDTARGCPRLLPRLVVPGLPHLLELPTNVSERAIKASSVLLPPPFVPSFPPRLRLCPYSWSAFRWTSLPASQTNGTQCDAQPCLSLPLLGR